MGFFIMIVKTHLYWHFTV